MYPNNLIKLNLIFVFIFLGIFNFPTNGKEKNQNILLIIGDDIGLDVFPGYKIGHNKAHMPNLEKLMKQGIRFNNFWTYPTCTPTRSSIITGKYGFRTNVLKVKDTLSLEELSLQTILRNKTKNLYSDAVIGKWHLSRNSEHPNKLGVSYYAGLLSGSVSSYSRWPITIQGKTSIENTYITSKLTDLAIDWINNQKNPWFLWLAYTAPHKPFHIPPKKLYNPETILGNIRKNPKLKYLAMLQAMDTEIGRLLSSIPNKELKNTVIIFIGDNGSPKRVIQDYYKKHAKGSLYQGGINTPFIVSGAGIKRKNQIDNSLINSTDLFATIMDLANTNIKEIYDSKSVVHLFKSSDKEHRKYIYSEIMGKVYSGFTIRNKQYKYINYFGKKEELYDLITDPLEKINLKKNHMHSDKFDKIKFNFLSVRNNLKRNVQ